VKANAISAPSLGKMRWVLPVIFVLSAVGLAYQITLTRVFSVILQYQAVFLIVSVSIMGLSIGAAVATLVSRGNKSEQAPWTALTFGAFATAFLLVASAAVLAWMRSADTTPLAFVAAMLPFVGLGYLTSRLFTLFGYAGGVLYAADLVGATLGLLIAFLAISAVGAFDVILLLAAVVAGVGCLLALPSGKKTLRNRSVIVAVVLILALFLSSRTGLIAFNPGEIQNAPPDKTLIHMLQSGDATLLETRWDPFARLDMVTTDDDTVRYIFTDAGAGSIMLKYDGDDSAIAWMRDEVEYLPFAVAPAAETSALIIGSGAGRDVLMAKLAGLTDITAVEVNPTLVQFTRDQAAYNGGVLDLPNVRTVVADGRNFVERSDRTYDLIYGNLVYSQAAAPGHSALSESYIFTREALQSYWRHLSVNGSIAFVTHQGIEGLRLLVAALDMLESQGMTMQEALQHVAFASRRSGDPQTRTSVVVISRQPWTSEESSAFTRAAHDRDTGVLYMPGYQETGLEPLATGAMSLQDFVDANADLFNYAPTTDDNPFFYQLTPGLPSGLSDLLIVSVIAVAVYLSWAIFFFVRQDGNQWKRAVLTPYFALLGAAYLLVEIPLIQRFGLLLGQPSLSMIVVIGALLLSSGLGSYFSSRFALNRLPKRVAIVALAAAIIIGLSLVAYPALIDAALPLSLELRILVTILAIFPLGFVMGVPFPSGLRVAHEADSRGIAAFWGANAVTSVLGSALAMALAMSFGFSSALLLGAVLYAAVALIVRVSWPRMVTVS
jgi:spermidine synthase